MLSNTVSGSTHLSASLPKPMQESLAISALGQLGSSISVLHEVLDTLAAKLNPVLNPSGPPTETNPSVPSGLGSPIPLVDDILRQVLRVQQATDHCKDLIQRAGV